MEWEWIDLLRVLAILSLGYGAWVSLKRMPKATRVNGRRYYRQPDGTFRTAWGSRVQDRALVSEIERTEQRSGSGDRYDPA